MAADYASTTMANLADAVRAHRRAALAADFLAGKSTPLVLPYSILGPFIIPTLWLAVPHDAKWPWRARWLVMVYIAWFSVRLVAGTSSLNHAFAYAVGLMAYWGVISSLNLLVWNDTQREAARVVKRPRKRQNGHVNGTAEAETTNGVKENGNGLRHRKHTADMRSKFQAHDLSNNNEWEYVWEPFPRDGPWARRFNWALDLTTNFRFVGWNTSISAIPRPALPPQSPIPDGTPADVSTVPLVTYAGYRRWRSERAFVVNRLVTIGVMYIVVDFLAVFMTKDPYFVLGPDHPSLPRLPLPGYLQGLHPALVKLYRQIFSMTGALSVISGMFNLSDLAQYYLASRIFPHRGDLWQHPNTFGSFRQVLDRGLGGWWGGCWHQTFRAQFVAPAKWLVKHGYVSKGSFGEVFAALASSFVQSGLLHAAGSITSFPETRVWRSPLFFTLQIAGILIQTAAAWQIRARTPFDIPRPVAQAANLAFTLGWLFLTADFFTDDLASAGVWLLEPVPFSFFRMFGFGFPGDRWWRWDESYRPSWHTGKHWWQSGIAM